MKAKSKDLKPRSPRRPVTLRGFALSETHDADVVVSDLSYEGCRIQSSEKFKKGESVELRMLRVGQVQAEIRWTAKGKAGARFVG